MRETGFETCLRADGSSIQVPYLPGPWQFPNGQDYVWAGRKADPAVDMTGVVAVTFELHVHPAAYTSKLHYTQGPSSADLVESGKQLRAVVSASEQKITFYNGQLSRPLEMKLSDFWRIAK